MTRRRAALSVALVSTFAAAAALQASCVSVFGVDEDSLHNAIADMCGCVELDAVESCEGTLTTRMNNASEAVQSAWLSRYVAECTECPNALICLSQSPTCSVDKCKQDGECCTVTATGKAKCVELHCKQPQ